MTTEISFTEFSRNITGRLLERIMQASANGIVLRKKNDEVVLPWDAYFSIKKDKLVIEGSVLGGNYGHVSEEIPLKDANDSVQAVIEWNNDITGKGVFKMSGYLQMLGYETKVLAD